MTVTLANLAPPAGARKRRKRIGRGPGSGWGTTAGKGYKGQKSRSGVGGLTVGFEGGQMPLQRRLPKRGFKNRFRVAYAGVNVGRIQQVFSSGATVGPDELKASGLVPRSSERVKVLGDGELTHALTISAHAFSRVAREKIEQVGGRIALIAAVEAERPKADLEAKQDGAEPAGADDAAN